MHTRRSNSFSTATVVALGCAAIGIAVQILSGADYPAVPPGLVILLVAAAFVWFAPWGWSPVAGVLAGLSQLIGLFAAGQATRLVAPDSAGDAFGLWVQLIAVAAAVAAGTAALVRNYRGRAPEAARR